MRRLVLSVVIAALGCDGGPWLSSSRIQVVGEGVTNLDCRTAICQHNENTDLTRFKGDIYLIHRTARSQILGPNSALHIYRATDGNGSGFNEVARIEAPSDRDIRDPHFYQLNDQLYIETLTRLPVTSTRDSNVDTITIGFQSSDGVNWTPLGPLAPDGWSFWRVQENAGTFYSAAYQDGDLSVVLYSSSEGARWIAGAPIYTTSADTPLETELVFMPSGRLLAIVRTDGTDDELLGDSGRLRTQLCWAEPPGYASFDCRDAFDDQRLDGPLAFFWRSRLFMVARKHLQPSLRKRTSLFEITGAPLDGGKLAIREWGELPSAGDTSYAGAVSVDADRFLVSWYSSDIVQDENWAQGILDSADIWIGTIDLARLK
jgi:hypothetical protein